MSHLSEHPVDDHPVLAAFDRAPVGKPYSPEQTAELDAMMAEIAAGRMKTVPHEDVHAWLESRTREEADVAAE